MCDFCERNQPIISTDQNNNYCFSLPNSSAVLMVTDKKRNREYLYSIEYCPICGKKCARDNSYKNKKCKLCEKQQLDFTSPGSNNKAEVFMYGANYLTFFGDDRANYTIECNYCPKCGKKLII